MSKHNGKVLLRELKRLVGTEVVQQVRDAHGLQDHGPYRHEHRRLLTRAGGPGAIESVAHYRERYYAVARAENGRTIWSGTTTLSDEDLSSVAWLERRGYRHTAVVVTPGGRCYVGHAAPSHLDSYNRQLGYKVALGKALKAMVAGGPYLTDEQHRAGRELNEWLRERLAIND